MEDCREFIGFLYDNPLEMLRDVKDFEELHYPTYGYFGEDDINMFSISWQSLKKLRIGRDTQRKKRLREMLKSKEKWITRDSGQTLIRPLKKSEASKVSMVSTSEYLMYEPLGNLCVLEYHHPGLIYFRDYPIIELNALEIAVELGTISQILNSISLILPDLIITLANRGWINISDNRYEEWTKKCRAV